MQKLRMSKAAFARAGQRLITCWLADFCIMAQAARAFARKGGQSTSPAKAAGARQNGKLGGRPRQHPKA